MIRIKIHGICQISCYATSIWDETLYNAWSKIMSLLIPNVGQLKLKLKKFADHINADEVSVLEEFVKHSIVPAPIS